MDSQDITFGGITEIIGAEFTLSRGVSPSVCTLFIRPQSALNVGRGPLTMSFGSSSITFPDMTPDVAHIRTVNSAKWALQLYDRRVYWTQGYVSGEYNLRQPDGTLKNEANSRLLADTLLKALGETSHDVSRMSQLIYPYCNWNGTNPALALANLLDYCSCTICPGPNNNLIVYPLGQGAELPDGDDDTQPFIPFKLPVPSEIVCVCGPDLFQSKLALAAATIGTDSKLTTPDIADYKPSAGWGTDFYQFFPNVASDDRTLAFGTMYRLFKPTGQAQGGLTPPGCNESVIRTVQYDLNDFTCATITDSDRLASDGKLVGGPYLDGTFWPQSDHALNTGANTVYTGSFKIGQGMVLTDYPVIKYSGSNAIQEPEMYLTTSYTVWNDKLTDKARYSKRQSMGGSGYVILRRPELFRVFKTNYSYTSPTDTQNNQAAIDSQCDEYLRLHSLKYQDPWILDREYHGLLPILTDGKIAQIRWRIGYDGPSTRASKNFEFDTCNVGEEERRRREAVAQLQEAYR